MGVLRVKKVKNVGSQIFIKISPEKYFDARTSMMRSVWKNFDAQGSFLGPKVNFRGFLGVKTSKSSSLTGMKFGTEIYFDARS